MEHGPQVRGSQGPPLSVVVVFLVTLEEMPTDGFHCKLDTSPKFIHQHTTFLLLVHFGLYCGPRFSFQLYV